MNYGAVIYRSMIDQLIDPSMCDIWTGNARMEAIESSDLVHRLLTARLTRGDSLRDKRQGHEAS